MTFCIDYIMGYPCILEWTLYCYYMSWMSLMYLLRQIMDLRLLTSPQAPKESPSTRLHLEWAQWKTEHFSYSTLCSVESSMSLSRTEIMLLWLLLSHGSQSLRKHLPSDIFLNQPACVPCSFSNLRVESLLPPHALWLLQGFNPKRLVRQNVVHYAGCTRRYFTPWVVRSHRVELSCLRFSRSADSPRRKGRRPSFTPRTNHNARKDVRYIARTVLERVAWRQEQTSQSDGSVAVFEFFNNLARASKQAKPVSQSSRVNG